MLSPLCTRGAAASRHGQAVEKYTPAPPRAPELADKALFSKNGLSEQELAELREIANEMQRQRDAALKLRFRWRAATAKLRSRTRR